MVVPGLGPYVLCCSGNFPCFLASVHSSGAAFLLVAANISSHLVFELLSTDVFGCLLSSVAMILPWVYAKNIQNRDITIFTASKQ